MPAYHVERSKLIEAPTERVHAALADYREWPRWSPWLIMEPETRLVYSDRQGEPGASYDWDGNLVGAGDMTMASVSPQRLDMDLHFIRPFKSRAKVAFNASRNRKVRTKKTPMGYERYLNHPADTPPEALITEILLPLKG